MRRFLLCALLFVAWTAERPVEDDPVLYVGLWRSPLQVLGPLFVTLPGVHQPAWRLLVLAMAPVCLLWPGALRKRPGPLDAAILISLTSLASTLLWGLWRGGSAFQAYFQLNAFVTSLVVAALLVSVVRTPDDLKFLGLTVLAAALVRGLLAVYFYVVHVRDGQFYPFPTYMTTHDDSLLWVAALLMVLSWALARRSLKTWLMTGAISSVLLLAIVVNNRRLAWVELMLGVVVIYRLLPNSKMRRRVNFWILAAIPVAILYTAVGWGRTEAVFAPLRALTVGSTEDKSSLARHEENANLTQTLGIAGNPLLGTGWGHPYQKITSWYANFGDAWWQYAYLPHNSLLAIAVFGGLVGLVGIWSVVPVTAFMATRGYLDATQAVVRAGAMGAAAVLPAYSAQCFGDIGFQSLTCGLVLSVAMAAAGKVYVWSGIVRAPRSAVRARVA